MYKGKKVLIVDDSPTERLKIKLCLKSLFLEVYEAGNALDGITKAEEINPDIIFMDVVMPGMNGFQATKQLSMKESLKDIPVIMCTSKNQPTDKIWGAKQGAKGYLVKPVEEDKLINIIRQILG